MVVLEKRQEVCLTKTGTADSENLRDVLVGLSWGKIKAGGVFNIFKQTISVDLDASILCYDKNGKLFDMIYYRQKSNANGSIHHSGDDLVGGGNEDEDNEVIALHLERIPMAAKSLVVFINSFSGEKFDAIPYVKARIYTGKPNKPEKVLCEYNMKGDASFKGKTSIVAGYLFTTANGWQFKAVGTTGNVTRLSEIQNFSFNQITQC